MAQPLYCTARSPRHGFEFKEVPTVRGNIWGGSIVRHYEESYGPILDCVYEMASDISSANGVSVDSAIDQVVKDENWRLIPRHRTAIRNRICDDRIELILETP